MSNLLRLIACLTVLLSFNVFAVDTDGDGFSDADEATLGTDPNDPTSPLENKLTASDAAEGDNFGYSVSIDGDTAVIGAQGDGNGSAYVYVRSNGVWSEQAKLTESDGVGNDYFGNSVSIDGDTAVIGAYRDHDNGTDSGSAYVYVRSNGLWSEQQKLTASDGAAVDWFGYSVSIEGDKAVIGARLDDDNGPASGSAYVFVRSNGVWNEQAKLTASDGAEGDYFGNSVSIDGDMAVIGANGDDDNGAYSGSAYVYVRSNGVWSEQAKLTASDGAANDGFGISVSIDDNTVVIGAHGVDEYRGSVYVYVRSNGVWSEQHKLTPSDRGSSARFGRSVSISGNTAVIGLVGEYVGGDAQNSGSAYVYVRSNGVWSEQQKLAASDGALNDDFGISVSIDGDTALVGSYNVYPGSAYVFPLSLPYQDTPASITGSTSANVDLGDFGFGTLIATDIEGLTDGSYFSISSPPTYGQALINPSSGVWTYIADSTYAGFDPFTVTVTDDLGGTTEQVVTITAIGPDTDGDGAYDFSDNCLNTANADQANLDGDALGDACDPDMDGDGYANVFEVRFGGDETDNTDAAVSLANAVTFSETAPADSDLDGVPDDYETAAGDDTTSSTFESILAMLTTNKNVPAMGGIGLLALGLSMLGLGAVRLKK